MFRVGVVELISACGLLLVVFIIPVMLSRFYARLDKRLKSIEKKIDKKKQM
jgi:hypothetical protein